MQSGDGSASSTVSSVFNEGTAAQIAGVQNFSGGTAGYGLRVKSDSGSTTSTALIGVDNDSASTVPLIELAQSASAVDVQFTGNTADPTNLVDG
jgi:hypothetical protein